jgi:eukaryotic-like serine/threonine-protein kinase
MTLAAGTHLGRYEIRSQLGAGGMGEVYLARDPKINRDVAIKVLPATFSSDAERLRRFELEVEASGKLNHPNIIAVYDVEMHDGSPYVVYELLEGETLRQRLRNGPLSPRKAIDYGLQIAHGLTAAHDKGIVHRDLKPENLFITQDDRIKILDFGLAKLTETVQNIEAQTDVLTRKVNTDPGAVMGTAGYMAPEQVRAQRVDHRSDIFCLGLILYEMLSGKRAFRGDTAVETLNAILKEDPPQLSESNGHINPALERVVLHCLEKNPAQRFQSTGDVAFALESLSGLSSNRTLAEELTAAVPRRNPHSWLPWIITAALLLALIAALPFAVAYLRRSPTEESVIRLSVSLPDKVTMSGTTPAVAISPDGRQIAFVATREGQNSLWVRSLDSFTPKSLAAMEISGSPTPPFWSPDSRFIGFFAGGKLKKVEASGGPPQTLCDLPAARGGTWNRDGVILVGTTAGTLFRVSQAGGELTPLIALDQSRFETSHRWPSFLPDGRHFLFFVRSGKVENTGVYVGSLDSKETRQLLPNVLSAVYAPPGFLLFLRNETLMAQPFDANTLKLTGEQVPIAEQVAFNSGLGRGSFSVSENGVIAFRTGGGQIDQPLWFDRTGKQTGALAEAGVYFNLALSPVDEKQAAVDRTDPQIGTNDIWLFDLARNSVSSRFTTDPAGDSCPLWSPDAKRIVFASYRTGSWSLYEKSASGGESEKVILASVEEKVPDDWSRDGKFIIYESFNGKTKWDLWLLRTADKNTSPLLQSEFNERQASFSPDGKYIAYTSDKSGSVAVYVQTFPLSGSEWRISTDAGAQPRWRSDGRELFYIGGDRKLMMVDVKPGSPFQVGVPKPLFETRVPTLMDFRNHYVVTADGQRFLINSMTEQRGSTPIDVVKNWTTLLKR